VPAEQIRRLLAGEGQVSRPNLDRVADRRDCDRQGTWQEILPLRPAGSRPGAPPITGHED
jgi:hypothetical protein